jgi:hypothetical protein
MQVSTISPQTLKRLLAAGLEMAKVFAVVALCNASLSYIKFYVDGNMAEAIKLECLLRFYVSY